MKLQAPCRHPYTEWVGTVEALNEETGAHAQVSTCAACAIASAGYVQMRTGAPARPLLTYEQHRQNTAALAVTPNPYLPQES